MTTETATEKIRISECEKIALLFVCTGNTCRSPMAAAVINAKYGDTYAALSAGTAAFGGQPISHHAATALEEIHITPQAGGYQEHASSRLDDGMMTWADKVVAMTGEHYMQIIMRFPEYAGKITTLEPNVADPFGGTLEDYRHCLQEICQGIKNSVVGSE